MRLLERDVHDKQDTLMLLRQQLEEVKKINTEFHTKQKVPISCIHVEQTAMMLCTLFSREGFKATIFHLN